MRTTGVWAEQFCFSQDLFLCSTQDRVARRVCGAGEPDHASATFAGRFTMLGLLLPAQPLNRVARRVCGAGEPVSKQDFLFGVALTRDRAKGGAEGECRRGVAC